MQRMRLEGLTRAEAQARLLQYGENRLERKGRPPALRVFAGQFRDAMVLILLAATVVSALLGEISEAFTIAAIVLLNAFIGFLQELRTEKTLEALARLAAPAAHVRREGREEWIDAAQVVPDDLLLVEAGDRVAADGVILECAAFSCDEAMLTGESLPEPKHAATGEETQDAEAHAAMAFMGTNAVSGRALVRVTATGMATQMGAIAGMLGEISEEPTPLQQRLDQVGRTIGALCLGVCAAVALAGILRGEEPLAMLLTGISLAVAAVPEGLPAIVTVSLALAVRRILKQNALVKRLHAVETLGCTTVICSDKTGTLTENRMTVKVLFAAGRVIEAERIRDHADRESVRKLLLCAACCNDAKFVGRRTGLFSRRTPQVEGEPTEAALLRCAAEHGAAGEGFLRRAERPFDSARKRMSVVGEMPEGARLVFVKGAPELVLSLCTREEAAAGVRPLSRERRAALQRQSDAFAAEALRVLGFAYKPDDGRDPEEGLIFLGFAGLVDPPRKEAFAAITACRRAGIRPVMITGDHEITATAIAQQLGILHGEGRVLTGRELDAMSDEALEEAAGRAAVFARVTPGHKLRIVQALQARGEIVAMTGDGVNDAPALKQAHIGVAMGKTGTDVTREAAQIILLDDNFATLVAAVGEGRAVYRNIRRFLRYLLSCNTGEVLTMFIGMLLGMPAVLTPIQLLLVNLVTDGLPAIALGLEPSDRSEMLRPPRSPQESIFSGGLYGRIAFRGSLIALAALWIFTAALRGGGTLETARTAALVTLVLTQLFHALECRSETKSLFSINPFGNPWLLLACAGSAACVAAAVWLPLLQPLFGTQALSRGLLRSSVFVSALAPVCSAVVSAASGFLRPMRRPDASAQPLGE